MIQKEVSKTKDMVILVVDDNRNNIFLIKEVLSEQGYGNILMASSGSQAISIIDERKPDLILLDIMMPDMDGYEVCSILQQDEEVSDIPVIMLTAKTTTEDLKKGFEVGAFDYIPKPFSDVELVARVQSALKLKQSRDELKNRNAELLSLAQKNQETIEELDENIREKEAYEEALRESEEKYSTLVELSVDGILLIQGGETIFANRSFYGMFGFSESEVLGKSVMSSKYLTRVLSFVSEKDRQIIIKRLSELMIEGGATPNTFQLPLFRKSGEVFWVEISTKPILFNKKTTEMLVFRDITEKKEAEEAIKSEKEKFQEVVENIEEGLFTLDKKGYITYANPEATIKTVGYTADEVIGKHFVELAPKESLSSAVPNLMKVFGGQSVSDIEIQLQRRDGTRIYASISLTPKIRDGKFEGIFGVINDITERKRAVEALRESEGRYSTIVEGSGDAIVIFKRFRIVFANKRAFELTGYSPEDVGSNAMKFIKFDPKQLKKALKGYFNLMANDDYLPATHEIDIRHKDGHIIPVELSGAKIEYDGGPSAVIFLRDITQRKQAEAELRETLEDLERSNKDLEEFAYVASHDLQEPLRMVSSYVQLLSRRYKGNFDSDADKYIEFAVDGAKRMQKMISSLLDYSRVGTRGKPFKSTNCKSALGLALDNLAIAIEESKAVITNDPMPTVMADKMQLVQVFQNIIGNAVKYRGGKVPRINISVDKNDCEWIFSVCDNGIGIDPEFKDQVFQVFSRLHGNEYSGTGIGLAVCKKIVERHGGRIWVKSELGAGSTFYFTIPEGGIKNE